MTVGELIEELKYFKSDCEVDIYFGDTFLQRPKGPVRVGTELAEDPWLAPVEIKYSEGNPKTVNIWVEDKFQEII
jgi:hypothetical protein